MLKVKTVVLVLISGDVTAMANGINTFLHSVSADLDPLLPPTSAPVMEAPSEYISTQEAVERRR